MSVIVKIKKVDGKRIEIHEDRFGTPVPCPEETRRYWAKVDGAGLFQRGRMRVRMFTTADAAWKAALEHLRGLFGAGTGVSRS